MQAIIAVALKWLQLALVCMERAAGIENRTSPNLLRFVIFFNTFSSHLFIGLSIKFH